MKAHEKYILDRADSGKEVNDNFVQVYEDHLPFLRQIIRDAPQAAELLLWLIEHMDERNALVVSQQALSEALKCHRNTINNHTRYLKEIKAIDTLKSGTTSIYLINKQIAWKSDADNKKYAQFTASVYVTEAEQDHPVEFSTKLYGHAEKKRKPGRPRKYNTPVAVAGIAGNLILSVISLMQL
jgi:hypothetical protein